jgi:uroporphyrinogen-III synthase
VAEDFRVEVELDDDEYGYSLWERLRALHLDDEARRRLGENVVVTRDGSQLFLYADDARRAREAEKILRQLVEQDSLTAEIRLTRWHPVEETWEDASVPLPRTPEDERAEYDARVAEEATEAAEEGSYDWQVVVHLASRDEASGLAERLGREGLPVGHRWRYVVIGTLTEEAAEQLADRIRREVPAAEVEIAATLEDLPAGPFQFVGF